MKKKEKNSGEFSKKAGLFLMAAWTTLLAGATFVSLAYERKQMPEVILGYPGKGEVSYSCEMEAEAVSAEEAEMRVPRSLHLPSRMFAEGKDLGIGVAVSAEKGETDFLVKIRLKEAGAAGETYSVTLSDTAEYEQVLDGGCIHSNDYGQRYVYEITESEGAWGKEYRLTETMVICFPDDTSVTPVAVYSELDGPVVLASDRELAAGMRVRVKDIRD